MGKKVTQVEENSTQVALRQLAEKTEQIAKLVQECNVIAKKESISFSLSSINLFTDEEAEDNWASSTCD